MDQQNHEEASYEAQDWEIVPVRSIKSKANDQRNAMPLPDPVKAIEEGLRQVFPPQARLHFHTARREILLAFRSIVDAALERVDSDVASERDQIGEKKSES